MFGISEDPAISPALERKANVAPMLEVMSEFFEAPIAWTRNGSLRLKACRQSHSYGASIWSSRVADFLFSRGWPLISAWPLCPTIPAEVQNGTRFSPARIRSMLLTYNDALNEVASEVAKRLLPNSTKPTVTSRWQTVHGLRRCSTLTMVAVRFDDRAIDQRSSLEVGSTSSQWYFQARIASDGRKESTGKPEYCTSISSRRSRR